MTGCTGASSSLRRLDINAIELVLTPGCNLRCSYCYQDRKQGRPMDWAVLEASLDLILASHRPTVTVAFSGGEPLLELALIRRGVAYIRKHRPRSAATTIMVSTNGTYLDEDVVAYLAGNDFNVQLSFDGVQAAQDRRAAASFGSLDQLLNRLMGDYAAWAQDHLNVNMTLTERNLCHFADSVAYFLDTGIREVTISPGLTHQPGWRAARIHEMEEQFERAFEMVVEHERRTGHIPFTDFRPRPPRDLGGALCRFGEGDSITVNSDGCLYGCPAFIPTFQRLPTALLRSNFEQLTVGPLTAANLEKRLQVFRNRAAASVLLNGKDRKRSTYGRCVECRYKRTCVICPSAIGRIPGSDDPDLIPDFLCGFQRVTAACRERMPKKPVPCSALNTVRLSKVERRVLDFATAWVQNR